MNYDVYKLKFKTPVHFGTGRLSGTMNTIYADTIFLALCCEAQKLMGEGGADKLCSLAENNGLRISDAMPYFNDALSIPKPIMSAEGKEQSRRFKA